VFSIASTLNAVVLNHKDYHFEDIHLRPNTIESSDRILTLYPYVTNEYSFYSVDNIRTLKSKSTF